MCWPQPAKRYYIGNLQHQSHKTRRIRWLLRLGRTSPKDIYGWNTYKWGTSIGDEIENSWSLDSTLKYNSADSLVTLLPEDDAATANWGSDWRMPTAGEINELINNCEYSWAEVNGVKGVKFTASNGNFIFSLLLAGTPMMTILFIQMEHLAIIGCLRLPKRIMI